MSNKVDNGHVTPELVKQVENVLSEAAKHRYSTAGVYGASNQVFKLKEVPQTCTSCVVLRANNLRKWYEAYVMEQNEKGKDVYGKKLEEAKPTVPAPRDAYNNVNDIYEAYVNEFDESLHQAEGAEKADIAELLDQNQAAKDSGLSMLMDSEVELLNARFAELSNEDQPGAKGLNESNIIAGGLDSAQNVARETFDVNDKDGNTHTVTFADDKLTFVNEAGETKNMKAGTYTLANGDSYAVQPGGKATLKVNDDIL